MAWQQLKASAPLLIWRLGVFQPAGWGMAEAGLSPEQGRRLGGAAAQLALR
jgi:hypothetical protein